jgi:CheY-specific phosphatase CheX
MLFALALLASSSGLFVSAQAPQQVGTWSPSGTIADGRTGAASVALRDGTTLIVGGVLNDTPSGTVLRYDPATNGIVTAGQLLSARVGHTATPLEDGRVLVVGGLVGGAPTSDIEVFDPETGGSTALAQLSQPRAGHAAARIADGIVVIFGGATVDGVVLNTVERVEVATGNVTAGSNRMLRGRANASATTLIDGRVLVAGGNDGSSDLRSAEVYYPWTQAFEPSVNQLSVARSGHSAVLLPNNAGVLIAGGNSNGAAQASVDLFLPAESPDPFSFGVSTFVTTGAMSGARVGAAAGPGREGYAWVDGGGAAESETYRFATIKTDKDDYAPGQTAVITGSGWMPGEDVRLLFQEDPAVHQDYELIVTADAAGNISWDQWAPEQHDVGVRFYLLASDSRSRAQTTFTDGNLSSSIVFGLTPTSVTPSGALNWTVTASCQDGGGPNTCASEGFGVDDPVQNGYSISIEQATNAAFTQNLVVRTTATTLSGAASGTFAAPATGGPYFYRARHANQNLADSPVMGNDPNSWQPQSSNTVTVTLQSDGTAPTTTKTVGTPKFGTNDFYVTGTTPFTLSCADNSGGTGCAGTFYQIVAAAAACPGNTNEALWISYSAAFTLPAPDGEVRLCYFSKDTAGNREAPKFQNHFRDTAAPQTTATATANAATYSSGAWTRFNVSVNLSAADGDAEAGVKEITYAATGATTIPSTTITGGSVNGLAFSAEGTTTLTFFAKDNVGNTEPTNTFTITIDKTAPSITDEGTTATPNAAGWYNADVPNRFKAADALSGLDAACLAAFPDDSGQRIQSKTTTGEGTAVTVTSDTCTDVAGNTAAAVSSAEFKIDKTGPVIVQHDFSPAANPAGWHNTNVTVRFKATDAVSGLNAACLAVFVDVDGLRLQTKTISAEGAAVTTTSDSCTDVAGNTAAAVTSTAFKIDKTAPVITQHDVTPAANAAGWHNTDVVVQFKVTDAVSGMDSACSIAFPLAGVDHIQSRTTTGEGLAMTVTSDSCTDVAGNAAAALTSTEFKIDKTAPAIVNLGPTTNPNANGWYNTDVINRFKATDSLSGLLGTCAVFVVDGSERIQSKTTTGEGNAVTVTSDTCADVAGNIAASVTSAAFKIDKTAPLIVNLGPTTTPNAAGWYNTDVTNGFKVTDALSGIDMACQAAFPLGDTGRVQSKTTVGEGLAVTVTSNGCADVAGNAAAGVASAAFKIDKTAPLVAITSPVSGTAIVLSIAVNGTASDALSGIKSVTLNGVAALYNAGTGTWATASNVSLACGPNTLTAVAIDTADLSSSATVTMTRLCFTFEYLRPLEQSYTGGPTVVNDGKYGRVIPVKGIVRRSGVVQTEADLAGLGLTLRIGVNAVPCAGGAATDAVEEYADAGLSSGGTNVFRGTLDGSWIYNLDTKAPPSISMAINNCYRLDAYVQDAATPYNKVKISDSPYAIFKPVK